MFVADLNVCYFVSNCEDKTCSFSKNINRTIKRHKMVPFTIFILSLSIATSCERIKLESKKHILCIADENRSPIYVYPPVAEDAKNDSILIEKNHEFWSDWELKNSKDVRVPMVVDKRWENFETIYTDHVYFPSVVALSVSETVGYTRSQITDHLPANATIRTKREARYVYWGHSSIRQTTKDFIPFQMNITSRKIGYWKIHDYNLRWAGNSSETETVVPISPDDASCVVLYTYLCPYCKLNITVDENIVELRGSERRIWTSHSFSVNQAMNITLSRSTTGVDTTVGQWAIDIRRCPPTKSNKSVYEVSLEKDVQPGTNRSCMFLSDVQETVVKPNTNIFNCDKGLLGRGCDVSCAELLGSDLKYCQQHQICDNTLYRPRCHCVGYGGPACEAECGEIETGECRSSASILNKSIIGLLTYSIVWATLT